MTMQRPEGFAIVPNWLVRDGSVPARTKAVYLVLSSHTGRDGTWYMSHQQIADESGVSIASVKRSLTELRAMGLVSWEQRQVNGGLVENAYRLTVSEPPAHSERTPRSPGPNPPLTMSEQEEEPEEEPQEEPQNTHAAPPLTLLRPDSMDEQFAQFWAAYPRHTDKAKALLAFKRARKHTPLSRIMGGVDRLVAENREPRFIPHPTTWLNGKRWEDEPVTGYDDRTAGSAEWASGAGRAAWESAAGQQGVAR